MVLLAGVLNSLFCWSLFTCAWTTFFLGKEPWFSLSNCIWKCSEIQYVSISVQFLKFYVINLVWCQRFERKQDLSKNSSKRSCFVSFFTTNTHWIIRWRNYRISCIDAQLFLSTALVSSTKHQRTLRFVFLATANVSVIEKLLAFASKTQNTIHHVFFLFFIFILAFPFVFFNLKMNWLLFESIKLWMRKTSFQ